MNVSDERIKEILLKENYITASDLEQAQNFAKKEQISLADYLISHEVLTKNLLGQAIAEAFNLPYADLELKKPTKDQILKVPEDIARKFRIVLFGFDQFNIGLATDNPVPTLEGELKKIFAGRIIHLYYALPDLIDESFLAYQKSLATRFNEIIKQAGRIAPEIVEEIISDAMRLKASDVHFDLQGKELIIRFRIDGVLYEAGRISRDLYNDLLNRIKVSAHLRIDEHNTPQDGAIHIGNDGIEVDLRVSIVPSLEGEQVVIRILSAYIRSFSLNDLGLKSSDQRVLLESAKKPFGMILVTGPTGSGKTTTLYAIMKMLNNPSVSITTIEDPVEYRIPGITQIQVNPQTDLTFAKGLKSITRQDPNIILVGEIRDEETAEIAVNAALTGHLLLTTFHANDAATAIPRLLDMGVEAFLMASTLELIVAQRLVRKICGSCRFSISLTPQDLANHYPALASYFPEATTVYKGKGCPVCSGMGYVGRIGIFEIIRITPEMKDLILKSPSTREVWQLAKSQGSASLFEDGITKVKNGVTTLEELMRVAPPTSEHIAQVQPK